MFNKLKRDFQGVRVALDGLFGKKVNLGLAILWYAITLPLGLLMYPFVKVYNIIIFRMIMKQVRKA